MKRQVLNIAHRGASGRFPENTLAAFRAAIDAGAMMCELDVQATRDNAVVVIHDKTVNRTTDGVGTVAKMTLAEIRNLDAGARFKDGTARGERVPTLDEVFAATAGKCGLNIELKAIGVEREVAALIRKWNAAETAMVSSFDWRALETMRALDSAIRIGVLGEKDVPKMFDIAARLGAYAINPRFDLATRDFCETAHEHGLKVLVWTVDSPGTMRMLIDNGVDGIMTNYPERMRETTGG